MQAMSDKDERLGPFPRSAICLPSAAGDHGVRLPAVRLLLLSDGGSDEVGYDAIQTAVGIAGLLSSLEVPAPTRRTVGEAYCRGKEFCGPVAVSSPAISFAFDVVRLYEGGGPEGSGGVRRKRGRAGRGGVEREGCDLPCTTSSLKYKSTA